MKTQEKLLLRVEIPFNKEENNYLRSISVLIEIFKGLEKRALPEHKFLMMNFVLSHETAEEDAESEET